MSPSNTSERALEESIEKFLSGAISDTGIPKGLEAVAAAQSDYGSKGAGYVRGRTQDFNAEYALDEEKLWEFLEKTQSEELGKLHYKPDWKKQIIERLHRKLRKDGILSLLKRGLDVDNAHLDLLYRLPYNDLNPDVTAKFESNVFSITRQVYFSETTNESVDLVLFINGLPVVTIELKNQWTGQTVNQAKKQYRENRDPNETLFQFRRCLVHFALDPDEAWMTTKLDGKDTYFLPFNRGHLTDLFSGQYAKDHPHESVPTYRLLVVANKFLTGFDEPLLHTMYVDKKLQGVLAVQTLSRLNRCNPKMRKQDTFVLDFYNSATDIKAAFDDFYTATSLTEPTDVNVLHDLKEKLEEAEIYTNDEVERFNELFLNNEDAETLHPVIDAAVAIFDLIDKEEEKIDFKIKAKQFVKLYGQLACIITFNNPDWEKLHWFLKFLIPKLKVETPGGGEIDELLDSVDLLTYALERVKLNQSIELDANETDLDPENPNVRGYHGGEEEESPLDEIIRLFNERWFSKWDATPDEQRVKLVNILKHVRANPDFRSQVLNNADRQNRDIALKSLITQAVNKERRRELELYKLYAGDGEFKKEFDAMIARILALEEREPPA